MSYLEIAKLLDVSTRYNLLFKDFDTLRWMGYNQLSNDLLLHVSGLLGYNGRRFFTTSSGHLACKKYMPLLCSHAWHWREGRTHIVLSFSEFNGTGNSIYYFEEREKNFIGKILGQLPYGLDEAEGIQQASRAFCQFRLTIVKGKLFIEEYSPLNDCVYCGEVLRLTAKDLHIKIINNGGPNPTNRIRKFEAIK